MAPAESADVVHVRGMIKSRSVGCWGAGNCCAEANVVTPSVKATTN